MEERLFLQEQEVLDVLSHAVWKTGLQMISELGDRGRGTLYVILGRLEDEGSVERRVHQEESSPQGFTGTRFEYRLTQSGIRRRLWCEDGKTERIGLLMEPA